MIKTRGKASSCLAQAWSRQRGDKTGQFYLLAAIVIITLIAGVFTITNFSKKKGDSIVYDLGEELKIESGKFLDRGAVTGNYDWDSFTSNFSNYSKGKIDIIYIVGNRSVFNSNNVYRYPNMTKQLIAYTQTGDYINITINKTDYKFKLKEGQNFYFIISQELEGERYVARN